MELSPAGLGGASTTTARTMELGTPVSDKGRGDSAKESRGSMGRRRRDFDEFEDETRKPPSGRLRGGWIVAATFIKYAAIVIIVLIIAYVVLRILGVLRGAL
jgi:hypothetical protein